MQTYKASDLVWYRSPPGIIHAARQGDLSKTLCGQHVWQAWEASPRPTDPNDCCASCRLRIKWEKKI